MSPYIDRGGRFAAKFHGLRFNPMNVVLYINGLSNNMQKPGREQPGWWERLKTILE